MLPQLLQSRRPGFDPWVVKIPWRREQLPTPVFWPGEEFHGLYSPWGGKMLDMTERLSLSHEKTLNTLVVREILIKTTLSYHFMPVKMTIIKKTR